MPGIFLSVSLLSLFLLLLFEPVTLRVRVGESAVIGLHLSVFALLFTVGKSETAEKSKKAAKKRRVRKRNRAPLSVVRSAEAALFALRRVADRFSVRIFTLAPTREGTPDADARTHGRYAVAVGFLSSVLRGFFQNTVTDADALERAGDVSLDFALSASLSDLFLFVFLFLYKRRKLRRKERNFS